MLVRGAYRLQDPVLSGSSTTQGMAHPTGAQTTLYPRRREDDRSGRTLGSVAPLARDRYGGRLLFQCILVAWEHNE